MLTGRPWGSDRHAHIYTQRTAQSTSARARRGGAHSVQSRLLIHGHQGEFTVNHVGGIRFQTLACELHRAGGAWCWTIGIWREDEWNFLKCAFAELTFAYVLARWRAGS